MTIAPHHEQKITEQQQLEASGIEIEQYPKETGYEEANDDSKNEPDSIYDQNTDLIASVIVNPELTDSELMVVEVAAEAANLDQVRSECLKRADISAERASFIGKVIDALQVTREQYEKASVTLKNASEKAGKSAEELKDKAEYAAQLHAELARLLEEESKLAKLVDDIKNSVKSCQIALSGPISMMIGSAAYGGEQPDDAIESAAVELTKKDNGHLYEQTAAYNISAELQRLEFNRNNLIRLQERIAEVKQKLTDHTDLAISYADKEREQGGRAISEAKDATKQGLEAFGFELIGPDHDLLDDIASDAVQAYIEQSQKLGLF